MQDEPRTACGLTCKMLCTLEALCEEAGQPIEYEHIFGTFFWLTCGNYRIVSDYMSMRDGPGWAGANHTCEKVHRTVRRLADILEKQWIQPKQEWLDKCEGIKRGTMETDIIFAGETSAIPCDEFPDTYQGKCAERVFKLFVMLTLTGPRDATQT